MFPYDVRTIVAKERPAELARVWSAAAARPRRPADALVPAAVPGAATRSAWRNRPGRDAWTTDTPGRARVALGRALQRAGDHLVGPGRTAAPARREA